MKFETVKQKDVPKRKKQIWNELITAILQLKPEESMKVISETETDINFKNELASIRYYLSKASKKNIEIIKGSGKSAFIRLW